LDGHAGTEQKRIRRRQLPVAHELLARLAPNLPRTISVQPLPSGNQKHDLGLRTVQGGIPSNNPKHSLHVLGYDVIWNALPQVLDPAGSQTDQLAAHRKRAQMTNILQLMQSYFETREYDSEKKKPLLRPGDVVVEFGAGTGDLGLLLAFFLHECTFVLVDHRPRLIAKANAVSKNKCLNVPPKINVICAA
jgi:hypothetical protein